MKTIKFISKLSLIAFAFFAFVSCDDDDDVKQPQTIAALAQATPNLSSLVAALQRADLVNDLNGVGNFTVFAPTNDAFTEFLRVNNFANLNAVPEAALRQVLLNHVIAEKLPAASLTTGYKKTLATYASTAGLNLDMFVNTANGVVLNGVSTVITPNIDASNGVIHIVNAVIGIPTVVTLAAANPATFSTLVTALTTLTPATDFAGILGRTAGGNTDNLNPPFTVFAPTNAAFTALGTPPAEATLTQVLLHHVVAGNVRSSALTPNGNTVAPSLQGQNLTITLPGTGGNIANLTDGAGNTNLGIIVVDVQAGNGVIHVINRVALPNLASKITEAK